MIYVDTNVIISYINREDRMHDKAGKMLAILGDEERIVSQFVVAELYAVFSRTMELSDVEIEALVEYSIAKTRVKVENVNCGKLLSEAQRYAPQLRLRILDLLHVISAHLLGAKGIVTLDKDIIIKKKAIAESLGLKVHSPKDF